MENDGKNVAHLHAYLEKLVLVRLNAGGHNGLSPWFSDTALDSVIVWMLWAFVDPDDIRSQPPPFRKLVSNILHPFIVMGFKFSSLYKKDIALHLPLHDATEPLAFDSKIPPTTTISHYSHKLAIAALLVVPAATLLYTARVEELQSSLTLKLPPESIIMAQKEAMNEFQYRTRLQTVQRGSPVLVDRNFDFHRRVGSRIVGASLKTGFE